MAKVTPEQAQARMGARQASAAKAGPAIPLLTMRSETVAVGCHWLPIRLFEPISELSRLRPVATACARLAP